MPGGTEVSQKGKVSHVDFLPAFAVNCARANPKTFFYAIAIKRCDGRSAGSEANY